MTVGADGSGRCGLGSGSQKPGDTTRRAALIIVRGGSPPALSAGAAPKRPQWHYGAGDGGITDAVVSEMLWCRS